MPMQTQRHIRRVRMTAAVRAPSVAARKADCSHRTVHRSAPPVRDDLEHSAALGTAELRGSRTLPGQSLQKLSPYLPRAVIDQSLQRSHALVSAELFFQLALQPCDNITFFHWQASFFLDITDICTIISDMDICHSVKQLNQRIENIKQQLLEMGPIHPGSISKQYHACGNPSCRCHDPVDPKKHGPYNKLTYSHAGKSRCRFVRPECLEQLSQRIENHKLFRKLMAEWVELSIQLGTAEFFNKADKRPAKPSH